MPVFNSKGERLPDTMDVVLRPGFGIAHAGQHLAGGPHRIPTDIAVELIASRRAEEYDPEKHDARKRELEVETRDPQPENRDELALRTRGKQR